MAVSAKQTQQATPSVANQPSTTSSTTTICTTDASNQQANHSSKPVMGPSCCAGCQLPIRDRFIFSVIEQNFHQSCVRCADCSSSLNERCYTFEGKLYCRLDYWRRFGPKCSACQESIKPTELVQRLKEDLVYHLNCFVCQDCKRHLQAGEQLHLIDDKRLLCKRDYLNITTSASGAITTATSNNNNNNNNNNTNTANQNCNHPNSNSSPQLHSNLKTNNTANGRSKQQVNGRSSLGSNQLSGNQENEAALMADNMSNSASNLSSCAETNAMVALANSSAANMNLANTNGNHNDDLDDLDELDDEHSSPGSELNREHQDNGQMQYSNNRFVAEPQLSKQEQELLKDVNQLECAGDELVDANGKRRGPRTTIKPKQLETLRQAFESAPKPSRHIREQLAAETGLNMRVIQVWFQNRRSKERRMKNTNGSARRNFFRSSTRRLRVGPTSGRVTPNSGHQQQSLIAGPTKHLAGKSKQSPTANQSQRRQMSPMEGQDQQQLAQMANLQPAQVSRGQHESPSGFGGSSSGEFTYYSDSSNQGDAFAMNTSNSQQQTASHQQQYLTNSNQDHQTVTLLALGSPSANGQAQQSANNRHPQPHPQQQQYGPPLQSIKNTPPSAPVIYGNGPSQVQPHLMLGAQMHHHQAPPHQHSLSNPHQHPHVMHPGGPPQSHQVIQQGPGSNGSMAMAPLLGHPQGPASVVQW